MKTIISLFSLLVLISACSSVQSPKTKDAKSLYEYAQKLSEQENYVDAELIYSEIKTNFPHSRYSALSKVRQADNQFADSNFLEAAASYKIFLELHPRHKEAEYALYKRAESLLKDTPKNIARDQTGAYRAINACRRFLQKHPQSKYKDQIKEIHTNARIKLALKESYVAKFYEKQKFYQASKDRWTLIFNVFKDIKDTEKGATLLKQAEEKIKSLEAKLS